jgi:HD-like signal output (HDOD) protein
LAYNRGMDYDRDERKASLLEAARDSLPLSFQLRDSYDSEGLLECALDTFLREAGQADSVDVLYYCVRELVDNAIKANAKRAYFAERRLSLLSAADYDEGMKAFRQAYGERYAELNRSAALSGLKVFADLRLDGELLTCAIRNSSAISGKETERVADRLSKARSFSSFEDAQSAVDSTEGAGLGLILLSQVLKKVGLEDSAFSIGSEGEETVARLRIPVAVPLRKYKEELSSRLVQYIRDLPTIPAKLAALLEALADEDVDLGAIADQIGADPALTAYILKVANSAAYQLIRRVTAIREAVKIIGIRALKYMLIQYGASTILGRLPADAKELWQHSNKVAYYARFLAQKRKAPQSVVDDALVGGVLHDMGMIIQYAVNAKAIKRIEAGCRKREIPQRLLEDIMTGLNHARIGGLLARKWNFPEALAEEIEFHHRPWAASAECRRATGLVYLADRLCEAGSGRIDYAQMDGAVLQENGIRGSEGLESLREEISRAYALASEDEGRPKKGV